MTDGTPGATGLDSAGRELLRQGRDSVSLYLGARGLSGLTMPCRIDYYRRLLDRQDGRRSHRIKLSLKIASLIARQSLAVAWHVPAVMARSASQALTRTTMQTLRTTPVTLAAMILLFLTSDAWKICGNEQPEQVAVILIAVLTISTLFFFAGSDNAFGHWTSEIFPDPRHDNLKELARQTTDKASNLTRLKLTYDDMRLGRIALINTRTVYVILVVINFLTVGFWAALALVFFGLLLFSKTAQEGLLGVKDLHPIFDHRVAGYPVALTGQLILVSLMLSGIAVLSFAATGLQDKDARDAFVKANITDLKCCISAFYFYRAAVDVVGAGTDADTARPGAG